MINKIVGISLGKDNPNYHCISLFSTGNPMMPGRKNYVLDDVVILYRLCMVYQMDAHNYSVRSVAGSEQKLVLLCLLSRSYCRITTCFKRIRPNAGAKLQNKYENFLRSREKFSILNYTLICGHFASKQPKPPLLMSGCCLSCVFLLWSFPFSSGSTYWLAPQLSRLLLSSSFQL